MRRLAMLCALCVAFSANADSFADRMREANSLLGSGNFEGAMAIYQDLKIDDPESDRIAHNMGLAKMRYADSLLMQGAAADAVESLTEAHTYFNTAIEGSDESVQNSAEFAAANTRLKIADAYKAQSAYKNALETYELAISEYEDILRRDPDHAGAKQNRALAKLRMKELMRDTPPEQQEQEQQGQQGQDENQQQDGEGEEQQGEQDQESSGEGEGERSDGEEESQQNEQQDGMDESQEGESEEQSAMPEESEEEFDLEDMKEANGEQTDPSTGGQPGEEEATPGQPTEKPSQQSIEALLQSLEQMDNRLQHDARRSYERSGATKRWW